MVDGLIPIEVYDDPDSNNPPLFIAELPAVPRIGEYLSKAVDGYFSYYVVKEVWYRQNWDLPNGPWYVCLLVALDD